MIIIFLKIGKIENNGIYVLLLKKLDIFLEYAGLFYFYFFNKFEQLDIPKGQNRVRLFCSIKQNYNFYNISVILIFEIISNNDYKQQRELIYQKIKNLKLKDIFFISYMQIVQIVYLQVFYIFLFKIDYQRFKISFTRSFLFYSHMTYFIYFILFKFLIYLQQQQQQQMQIHKKFLLITRKQLIICTQLYFFNICICLYFFMTFYKIYMQDRIFFYLDLFILIIKKCILQQFFKYLNI
eukprot:TRINITY_DN658_c1_g1_i1.p2 TRINITY_DN658_c1_g1~~TRINITY_DN658_c1_g1_i1.p2  ORF type:complete len:238 (-),score=-5.66 TRINITY_DN658_c1_g1_i1:694-1407(-)